MKLNAAIVSLASLFLTLPVQGVADDEASNISSVRLSVGEDGAGVLTIDSRPADESGQAEASTSESVDLKLFGKATISKLKDGRLDVNYDFSKVTDTNDLIAASIPPLRRKILEQQLSIDTEESVLVLVPNDTERAILPFPRMIRPPFDLQLELMGHKDGLLQLTITPGAFLLGVSLHGENSPEKGVPAGTIAVFERPAPKEQFNTLLKVIHGSSQRREYRFQVDKNAIQRNTFLLINYIGELPLAIRSIQVAANFPPSFGMALGQRGTRVMVTQVLDDSAADESGIKKGDILLTVDSKAVKDTATALEYLAECELETPIAVDVLRYGKKKTITVTPK